MDYVNEGDRVVFLRAKKRHPFTVTAAMGKTARVKADPPYTLETWAGVEELELLTFTDSKRRVNCDCMACRPG